MIRVTEQKLHSIINHLKKFQDVKQYQEYNEQRSQKKRLVLIDFDKLCQFMFILWIRKAINNGLPNLQK